MMGLVVGTSHSLSAPSSAEGRSCIEISASESFGLAGLADGGPDPGGERGEDGADSLRGETEVPCIAWACCISNGDKGGGVGNWDDNGVVISSE